MVPAQRTNALEGSINETFPLVPQSKKSNVIVSLLIQPTAVFPIAFGAHVFEE